MRKMPYKPENPPDDDDDYEIVSFEEFCDKSPGSKIDLLTLNDNINYRLCYESHMTSKFAENGETSSQGLDKQSETSLNGSKHAALKNKNTGSFALFGRSYAKTDRKSLFGGVLPKSRNDGEYPPREPRYRRFPQRRSFGERVRENLPRLGSGVLGVALVCALCVGAWWIVCRTIGGSWGEEHYRRLWERAHPTTQNIQYTYPTQKIPSEKRYHDHRELNQMSSAWKPALDGDTKRKFPSERTCSDVPDKMKFDCYPNKQVDKNKCMARDCCWRPVDTKGVPYCYYPPHYNPFTFVNMTENRHGMTVYYIRNNPSGYPDNYLYARVEFKYLSNDILQIKMVDPENSSFEVPIPEIPIVPGPISNLKYRVQIDSPHIGFKVIRNADNVTIVNTQCVGALILSRKFLQMSTILPTEHVFGFGEHRAPFKRDMNWNTFTMFNKDTMPVDNMNLYGTHPFYLAVEEDGNSHGMLLLNSNAMDVAVQPTPAITFRTIGGILNFFVFTGPSPKEVIAQYTSLIGRPFMPPYWGLGFHLCKYGYHDLNTTERVWQSNRDAGIPFDVQWNDIDYMETENDFTIDPVKFAGLDKFVQKVHDEGMHYVMLFDPGVSANEKLGTYPPYDLGLEMGVFVRRSREDDRPFIAKVWNPVSTVFPDFTHPNSTQYWLTLMSDFHKRVPYDGAWIDMNEPSNFLNGPIGGSCEDLELSYKPVWLNPTALLNEKTVCMEAKHHMGEHYDVHNLHALAEAITTHFALTEIRSKRPFIISRATFPGIGRYAGHWSGDIRSTWDDMRMTIPDLLNFAIFGIPMMGSDICGFNQNTTVELCKRWMQLGAFYPFSRNHGSIGTIPQDPVSLGPEVVNASIKSLRLRYTLLPYYYTLFWRAHIDGDTVVRPLFFEAPSFTKLFDIDDQFMVGPYIMVTPILEENSTHKKGFFPGPQRWYNILDGKFLVSNDWYEVDEDQTVSVKGGAIIPLQSPTDRGPVTTTNSRSRPMQLLVVPDNNNTASGELYWDDGDSLNTYEEKKYTHLKFSQKNNELRSEVIWWGYGVPSINNITIFYQLWPIDYVMIHHERCHKPDCYFKYIYTTGVLQIYHTGLPLAKPIKVQWFSKRNFNKSKPRYLDILGLIQNSTCKTKDCSEYD